MPAPPADPLVPSAKISAKRGPKTALDDDALLVLIRADLAASPFTGEGHRKVHARLHFGNLATFRDPQLPR